MDRDSQESASPALEGCDAAEKSFVGKFKSHVSGILNNTPLSKWFRRSEEKQFRRRDDDDDEHDEELARMQPPLKKVKLPSAMDGPVKYHQGFASFPEPVAGPSGVKSRKLLTSTITSTFSSTSATPAASEVLNGHNNNNKDSDSEESTSGYSSVARISSKEQVFESRDSSKQTSPLENSPTNSRSRFAGAKTNNRSLFHDSNVSPRLNSSLSSRRPSFNVTTFGSPHFMDKTLSTKRIVNSPFYNGRTTFGGASAYSKRPTAHNLVPQIRHPPKNMVQIKPVNNLASEHSLALGKTAQRILTTLEQYSTPVSDAKKIPVVSKKMRSEGFLTKYTGANPYTFRGASNSELQVPSVSDLLKMKQSKERLQESTETVRQLATSSKSSLNTEYKIVEQTQKPQHTGKVRSKVTSSVRQKALPMDDVLEVPVLNPVALPITNLPKFDLKIPAPVTPAVSKVAPVSTKVAPIVAAPAIASTSTTTSGIFTSSTFASSVTKTPEVAKTPSFVPSKPSIAMAQATETDLTKIAYKFADPLVISENLKSLVGINNYKFSEPISRKLGMAAPSVNFNMPVSKPFAPLPTKSKVNGDLFKPAPELKTTGSVMDILGKKPEGTWECDTCLIRNQPEKTRCAACETPKPIKTAKPASKQWKCDGCWVQNNESDAKCACCGQAKDAKTQPISKTTNGPGLFKQNTTGTWECDACLVRNKSEAVKCVACETPKKGASQPPASNSLMLQFKAPSGQWECSQCLVSNKSDALKCIACEAAKPGAAIASFGTPKKEESKWECPVCMVKNEARLDNCVCCEAANPKTLTKSISSKIPDDKKPVASFNFGIDKSLAHSFSFGIPAQSAAAATTTNSAASSIFGEAAKVATEPATTPSFSFGLPATAPKLAEVTTPAVKPIAEKSDTFTATPSNDDKPKPSSTTSTPTIDLTAKAPSAAATPTFSFGSNTPKSTSTSTPLTTATFNFKPVNGDLSKPAPATTTPTFSFGAGAKTVETPKTGLTAAPSTFNFAPQKPAAIPALGTALGGSSATQADASKGPVFKFGSAVPSPARPEGNPFDAAPKMTNGFGVVPPAAAATNNFNNSTTAPSFGTTANFSSETKPFSFGGSTNAEPQKAPAFSFGSNAAVSSTPAASTGGFNFSAPPAAPAPAAVPAPAATGLFSFSAQPKPEATPSLFGGAASTVKNGTTFNFGSAAPNNNQKASFSFGASVNAAPASTGFSFGAAPTSAAASGGFNFSAAASVPTFDANAKPSFNFSQGQQITNFNAAAAPNDGQMGGPRKIRKAVRRTQR